MPDMVQTNRGQVALPTDISQEIIAKTQNESAIMRLARHVALPGRGLTIPMITSDPQAAWVEETGLKPVSNPGVSKKIMQPYKLAVIELFSKEFTRDLKALYDELVRRLPNALSVAFDATVLGAMEKPGENFDTFASCTAQSLIPTSDASTYDALVAADTDIAVHGGVLDGWALGAQARGILLGAKDGDGRPLFINSAAEGAIPLLLGARTFINRGIYKAGTAGSDGTPAVVGIAGDWTKARFGTVNSVEIDVTDKAPVVTGSGTSTQTIYTWQQNMIAVRAEIEVGFVADTACFNLLTGAVPTE